MPTNQPRIQAIQEISRRELAPKTVVQPLSEIWAQNVFTLDKLKLAVPKDIYKSVELTVRDGGELDSQVAGVVAAAMKSWAVSRGARYYAHVFYPLTNATAEKHDGFIALQGGGVAVEEFSGKALVQGEPDGSSFPTGGIRATFEARGYTAWDVTSPAYIIETSNGVTLCIPTAFVSWTGEALDKKTPLLRASSALDKAAKRVLKLLGHEDVATVSSSCGAEQEYFLIDTALATLRPDLLLTGRTLFGKPSPKGQQFDDQYFGAIPERVQVFMQDVEEQLYKLGIPAKTRHNEVAPAQFEIAPFHESANVATDHQQMIMTTLKHTAKRHGFMCLLHEKPFAGINGSGKHVNWSVGNSTQGNLLEPGDTPHDNAQFLLFCGAVIRGVHKYGPLLRAVIASASNDHRLGANEAPPAIMSVYLGSQLEDVYAQIQRGSLTGSKMASSMDLGVASLPKLPRDAGDRNRTSPFAFTGNRFEFRAVGSSQSVAGPLVAMNTMMADSLNWVADKLEAAIGKGGNLQSGMLSVLKTVMDKHGAVIFGGDGYSAEWHAEAEKRGLANLKTSADALPVLKQKEIEELFEKLGVLSPVELASRFEVYSEQYILSVDVEAKLVVDMVKTRIYPAALAYLSDLADTAAKLKAIGVDGGVDVASKVAKLAQSLLESASNLDEVNQKGGFGSTEEHLTYSAKTIKPLLDVVRSYSDALEAEVSDEYWPLPSYQEMLFVR